MDLFPLESILPTSDLILSTTILLPQGPSIYFEKYLIFKKIEITC